MKKGISDLEREFYIQRDRLLKGMLKQEQTVRKELDKFLGQMAILKGKQRELQILENKTKNKLQLEQQRLEHMKKQEKEDIQSINYMKNRIKQLKKEIPMLERSIIKIIPERNKIAKNEQKIEHALTKLNKQIMKKQAVINILKSKMKKLSSKEDFIKKGKIVWGEFKPKQKKMKKRMPIKRIKKIKERSFLDIFR